MGSITPAEFVEKVKYELTWAYLDRKGEGSLYLAREYIPFQTDEELKEIRKLFKDRLPWVKEIYYEDYDLVFEYN